MPKPQKRKTEPRQMDVGDGYFLNKISIKIVDEDIAKYLHVYIYTNKEGDYLPVVLECDLGRPIHKTEWLRIKEEVGKVETLGDDFIEKVKQAAAEREEFLKLSKDKRIKIYTQKCSENLITKQR